MDSAAGLPIILNCLLQDTLRNLCTSSSTSTSTSTSSSSKWVYSIFWRILPRNYPPPKWEHGGSVLDRVKGNKRNWILVWEDGFCDFFACQGKEGGFGADLFFKMSHELYNYGEGLVGKVAADNSHKWVFQNTPNETSDPNFIFSRNASLHHQPKAWEAHFNSGIQTIAIISVREGIVQLGSFDKVDEDFNLVISIQRKFSYLQSIPGIYAVQRPSLLPMQIQYPLTFKPNQIIGATHEGTGFGVDEKRQLVGSKRLYCDRPDDFTANNPHNGSSSGPSASSVWSIPPLFPWTPTYPGTKPSKLLAISPSCSNQIESSIDNATAAAAFNTRVCENTVFSAHANECDMINKIRSRNLKADVTCKLETAAQEDRGGSIGNNQVNNKGAFDLN